ncbi:MULTISPECIES: hypothetical protein [Bacteria]|uniref:Gp10 n=2 Tax=root TaxID=1 RepID=Q6QID9_BPBMU|nr:MULTISPECIES: hypothetical protein [Bacteria]YP_024683.1 gp10 [Burkholderia phage BcepMu]KIS51513.1 putative phage protein [Burkholderia cepacia]AAS47850.1 gp10 [Burkholderia phage BcepMu]ERI27442.1 hypothetical protein BURCENBC7_AP0733 [Burkholderia cenocepacia BC7]MCW3656986.1 hypothetical protein [Burkholderia cenocepacia]MDS0805277.1 hypothetical protein [Burkholderia cenocepacia]
MTKGRKPSSTNNVATTVTDADVPGMPAMVDAANQLAVLDQERDSTVRAVATQLGYQLPADCTDPDLIQRDIAANMRRSVEACLEVGRGLRVLKEACEHGQFGARLDVLGIEPRVAQRFMASATKFSKAALTPLLKAAGNQTKLFEMLVLDDEQIEELELTGQTGELKLDDIATMSVKELRGALREAREQAAAQTRLLSDKNAKIDELAAKKTRVKKVTPDEEGAEIRKETSAIAFEAESVIRGNLRAAFETLAQHAETHGAPHDDFMAGVLGQIQLSLNQLRSEFGVKAAADGDDVPQWLRDTSAGSADADFSRAAN